MTAHWVYRCWDTEGRLAYIGATKDLGRRLDQHASTSWWADCVAKVTAKVYPSKPIARRVEHDAIRVEQPRWNVMRPTGSRLGWTLDQYRDYHRSLSSLKERSTPAREKFIRTVENECIRRHGEWPGTSPTTTVSTPSVAADARAAQTPTDGVAPPGVGVS